MAPGNGKFVKVSQGIHRLSPEEVLYFFRRQTVNDSVMMIV